MSAGRIYAIAAFVVAALFPYVWLFQNSVPFAPLTLVTLSVGAAIASGASRRALLPEHKTIPGLLNPAHVRLYLPHRVYLGFWLSLLLLFGFFVAGLFALGNPSREASSAWLLLLSGWWFFEFYFAAAMLTVGVAPVANSSHTQ
jgi:hypothetical protein